MSLLFDDPAFAWRQSSVKQLMSCPRAFKLEHVDKLSPDYNVSHFAAPLGTADHATIAYGLAAIQAGEERSREELAAHGLEAFETAVREAEEGGASYDPEGLDRAFACLEGERLDRIVALLADPRVRSIRWLGLEEGFELADSFGHRWTGTIDAYGIAQEFIPAFGQLGREPVAIEPGELVVADWKTGECPPFGFVERSRSVQLGFYTVALLRKRPELLAHGVRTFLGILQDLDRPTAPTDDEGKRIPKNLPKQINPEWATAAGLSPEEAATTKGRPKGIPRGVLKWLPEQPNPEFERACQTPKGPLFREARVAYGLVLEDVLAAIRGAELGLFPATGAVTGQCGYCPFSTVCLQRPSDEDQE